MVSISCWFWYCKKIVYFKQVSKFKYIWYKHYISHFWMFSFKYFLFVIIVKWWLI